MKFSIIAAPFLTAAVVALLEDHNYDNPTWDVDGQEADGFIQVNSSKLTFKHRENTDRSVIYNPATQWAEVVAAVKGFVATAPEAAVAAAFSVGDQVTATNSDKTKAKFRLQEGHVYTVDRITAKGNLGLAGLPNDEYLQKRFTKVGGRFTEQEAFPTHAPAVDADGNTINVGDSVLVTVPSRRDGRFGLIDGAVAQVTEITAKGNIGFGGADQYLPKRFVKVTLCDSEDVQSGDTVICVRDHKDSRRKTAAENQMTRVKFALPLNKALTFRGVTVDKGNFILDGYTDHQYSPSRFKKVVRG